jgi:hypothetical protein
MRHEQKQEAHIVTREEVILAPGWAEAFVMEAAAANASSAMDLDILSKRQSCRAGYGYCSSKHPLNPVHLDLTNMCDGRFWTMLSHFRPVLLIRILHDTGLHLL